MLAFPNYIQIQSVPSFLWYWLRNNNHNIQIIIKKRDKYFKIYSASSFHYSEAFLHWLIICLHNFSFPALVFPCNEIIFLLFSHHNLEIYCTYSTLKQFWFFYSLVKEHSGLPSSCKSFCTFLQCYLQSSLCEELRNISFV